MNVGASATSVTYSSCRRGFPQDARLRLIGRLRRAWDVRAAVRQQQDEPGSVAAHQATAAPMPVEAASMLESMRFNVAETRHTASGGAGA